MFKLEKINQKSDKIKNKLRLNKSVGTSCSLWNKRRLDKSCCGERILNQTPRGIAPSPYISWSTVSGHLINGFDAWQENALRETARPAEWSGGQGWQSRRALGVHYRTSQWDITVSDCLSRTVTSDESPRRRRRCDLLAFPLLSYYFLLRITHFHHSLSYHATSRYISPSARAL